MSKTIRWLFRVTPAEWIVNGCNACYYSRHPKYIWGRMITSAVGFMATREPK